MTDIDTLTRENERLRERLSQAISFINETFFVGDSVAFAKETVDACQRALNGEEDPPSDWRFRLPQATNEEG